MLFRPARGLLWDTWIYPYQDRFYLFWLQDRNGGFVWDSLGLAESEDLVHWREIGTIVEKAADAQEWMGTGRTWRAGDRFLLSFSEFRNGVQSIRFAESRDLRSWRRVDLPPLEPDGRWYVTQPAESPEPWARLDLLCPTQLSDGSWIGHCTAHSRSAPPGVRSVIGLARSRDGEHWEMEGPASSVPVPLAEVSGTAVFEDRWYAFLSMHELWGPRFDRFTHGQQGNGMWYWCADRPEGPFAPPDHDSLLHGQRATDNSALFGAPFRHQGRWLWNHHWLDAAGKGWLAPVKVLVEERPWHLALRYWEGNDGLRGAAIDTGAVLPVTFPRPRPTSRLAVDWSTGADWIEGSTEQGTGVAVVDLGISDGGGATATATLSFRRPCEGGAGLFVGAATDQVPAATPGLPFLGPEADGLALLVYPAGRAVVGRARMGYAMPRLVHWETFDIPPLEGAPARLRLMACGSFVEMYLDDRLLRTLSLTKGQTFAGRIGLWIDRCAAALRDLRAWRIDPLGEE